jgi:hypothetical protein
MTAIEAITAAEAAGDSALAARITDALAAWQAACRDLAEGYSIDRVAVEARTFAVYHSAMAQVVPV